MNMRKIAGGFVVIISLFAVVVSVPIVARWQLEKGLSELFGESARVASVSINPFTGNLQVRAGGVSVNQSLYWQSASPAGRCWC